MAYWRRLVVAGVGALTVLSAGAVSAAADGRGDSLVSFDSMTPVTGAAVGTVNDRGIKGGGFPWAITSGVGSVDHQGDVSAMVKGLVIPVAPFNGKNPVPVFKAVVSCITPHGVVNVSTGNFPASMAGDSTIHATVDLPHPCKDPEVFVGATIGGTFLWFAESNDD
jgi:hypothetical protein